MKSIVREYGLRVGQEFMLKRAVCRTLGSRFVRGRVRGDRPGGPAPRARDFER